MPTVQWLPDKMKYGRCNTVTFSDLTIPLRVKLTSGNNVITDEQLKLIKDSPMYSQRLNEGSLVVPKGASIPTTPTVPPSTAATTRTKPKP